LKERKPAGGEAYYWTITHPDRVSCIYVKNPLLRSLQKVPLTDSLAPLAKAGIPLLHLCDTQNPWYDANTREVEKRYRQMGGDIKVFTAPAGIVEAILKSQH